MKVKHTRKFNTISDISDIAKYVRDNYDPLNFTCKEVCEGLATKYSNLIPVEISTLIWNGQMRIGGHWVCKVAGTDFILDPTADQFDYEEADWLKLEVSPWLFIRSGGTGYRFFSMNHSPYSITEGYPFAELSDIDILDATNKPYYQQLKCLIIDN